MPDNPRKDNRLKQIPTVFDSFSGGMNDRDHPSSLQPNQFVYAENIETRESGLYKTRRGSNTAIVSAGALPQGLFYFEPSAGNGFFVQVNEGKVWKSAAAVGPWSRVDASVTFSNTSVQVGFAVLNNVLYIHAGASDNVRSWDGSALVLTDEGNTNTDPPRSSLAIEQSGRICAGDTDVTATSDQIAFSDIDDGHTYNRTSNIQNVPTNGTEPLTALATYRKQEILAWTRSSTQYFDISGSTISNFTRTTLDPVIGTVSPLSVVVIGEDAFFLSTDRQVRTIKRTVQDLAYGVSLPVTTLVPNLMARINATYSYKAASIYFDNYYLLAVPIDNSTTNNAVIVFDMLHQQQISSGAVPVCVGVWKNIRAQQWAVTNFSGKQELYYLDSMDGTVHKMFTLESDDGTSIVDLVQTRAANWDTPRNDKTIHDGEIALEDTYGTISIDYAKDDQVFTSLISSLSIGTGNPTLPVSLPFTLGSGGVLFNIPLCFYRTGRSRNWSFQITHTNGVINMKAATLAGIIESVRTRNL